MDRVLGSIAKARSFHGRQLSRHRKVIRVGSTRFMMTKGHAAVAAGGFFASGSVSSPGVPDVFFWAILLGGWFGGWFVFPVPDSSIASKRGPADVSVKSAAELDSMTPDQIRAYENNMVLRHRLKDPKVLGAGEALGRQREAVRAAEQAAGMTEGSLGNLSVTGARAFSAAAARHEVLKNRWLSYEVDPKLQFDYPAMSDTSVPATSAMIRAMHAADTAKTAGRPAEYQPAVAAFGEALTAAEASAGVPDK